MLTACTPGMGKLYLYLDATLTSVCSAASLGCKHDTARVCCSAPCCGHVLPQPGCLRPGCVIATSLCCNGTDRQTDGQTDTVPLHEPAPHTMRAVPKTRTMKAKFGVEEHLHGGLSVYLYVSLSIICVLVAAMSPATTDEPIAMRWGQQLA